MRPRSAASSLAFFAAFSLSVLSRSLASFSVLPRLKISLPLSTAGPAGRTDALAAGIVMVARSAEDVDVGWGWESTMLLRFLVRDVECCAGGCEEGGMVMPDVQRTGSMAGLRTGAVRALEAATFFAASASS